MLYRPYTEKQDFDYNDFTRSDDWERGISSHLPCVNCISYKLYPIKERLKNMNAKVAKTLKVISDILGISKRVVKKDYLTKNKKERAKLNAEAKKQVKEYKLKLKSNNAGGVKSGKSK